VRESSWARAARALGSQRLRSIQHRRNPLLLRQRQGRHVKICKFLGAYVDERAANATRLKGRVAVGENVAQETVVKLSGFTTNRCKPPTKAVFFVCQV
jgi:hypothetical protein